MTSSPHFERFIDLLRTREAAGAVRAWSAAMQEGRRLSLGIKDREIGNPHSPLRLSEDGGLHYRIVWDQGTYSAGRVERRTLADAPEEALDEARETAYDDPDAAWIPPAVPLPAVETHVAATARIAAGDTTPFAERLGVIRARFERSGARTWSGGCGASEGSLRYASSEGADYRTAGTGVSWYVGLDGELGDGHSGRHLDSDAEFDARLSRLFSLREIFSREATPPAPGTLPVLLDPGVVESYVLGTLFHHLSGSTVAHGEGRFSREDFGSEERLLRDDLELSHDPTVSLRRGTYRFTGEGVPAAPVTYVRGGRLVTPRLGLKYARRLGLEPNAAPAAYDCVRFTGAEVVPFAEGLRRAAGGIRVLGVLGVHTQDIASGDFSLAAPQSLAVGDEGETGRVRATISGNLFDVLRDRALRFVSFEGETTPGLLFSCRVDPK